jgi:hypothetical protein
MAEWTDRTSLEAYLRVQQQPRQEKELHEILATNLNLPARQSTELVRRILPYPRATNWKLHDDSRLTGWPGPETLGPIQQVPAAGYGVLFIE